MCKEVGKPFLNFITESRQFNANFSYKLRLFIYVVAVTKDYSNVINEECGHVHTMSFTTSQFSVKVLTDSSLAKDEARIFILCDCLVFLCYTEFRKSST